MDNSTLEINNTKVGLGEKRTLMIKLPSLYDCSPLNMPVHILRGKKPGKTLLVTAALHGDEINGVEIVRQILKRKNYKQMHGTLIAIPIVNVYGFLLQDRYLMDRRDLNRSFPGSKIGSIASRLAHILSNEILPHADCHIDLHSGSLHRNNFPQIRVDGKCETTLNLAKVFNAPVILKAQEREGSLRKTAEAQAIPSLLYEAGEALRFDNSSIKIGVRGILKTMIHLGIFPPEKIKIPKIKSSSFIASSSYWLRSPYSGIFRTLRNLGKSVKKGEIIGHIGNPLDGSEQSLIAPASGIIIGLNNLPLVHEGSALFNIACFEELQQVEKEFQSKNYIFTDVNIEYI
ncbi:MAG: succinylglutamate desuccinylase/aspartoacylase family protein [Chlamydiota bacterium]|nr:succinylglutamate desuccinylase/aspartoacylase family protein [Chlamydiota bacterium]